MWITIRYKGNKIGKNYSWALSKETFSCQDQKCGIITFNKGLFSWSWRSYCCNCKTMSSFPEQQSVENPCCYLLRGSDFLINFVKFSSSPLQPWFVGNLKENMEPLPGTSGKVDSRRSKRQQTRSSENSRKAPLARVTWGAASSFTSKYKPHQMSVTRQHQLLWGEVVCMNPSIETWA